MVVLAFLIVAVTAFSLSHFKNGLTDWGALALWAVR